VKNSLSLSLSRSVLAAFIFAAVFGLYAMAAMPTHAHGSNCPFSTPMPQVCGAVLVHIEHWERTVLALLVEVLLLIAFAGTVLFTWYLAQNDLRGYVYVRLRERVPIRPALLQELFSQGILHRKEPQVAR
jgi:hypothetical protein